MTGMLSLFVMQCRGRGTEAWQACNTWVLRRSYNLLQWNHGIYWSGFREYAYGGEKKKWKVSIIITNCYKFCLLFVYAFLRYISNTRDSVSSHRQNTTCSGVFLTTSSWLEMWFNTVLKFLGVWAFVQNITSRFPRVLARAETQLFNQKLVLSIFESYRCTS